MLFEFVFCGYLEMYCFAYKFYINDNKTNGPHAQAHARYYDVNVHVNVNSHVDVNLNVNVDVPCKCTCKCKCGCKCECRCNKCKYIIGGTVKQ